MRSRGRNGARGDGRARVDGGAGGEREQGEINEQGLMEEQGEEGSKGRWRLDKHGIMVEKQGLIENKGDEQNYRLWNNTCSTTRLIKNHLVSITSNCCLCLLVFAAILLGPLETLYIA